MPIYLDHNATTALHPKSLAAYRRTIETVWGNPSSPYQIGQLAKHELDAARKKIAHCVGATSNEILFTSGGTESINWVLSSLFLHDGRSKPHIISCKTEHHATLYCLEDLERRGAEITLLPVDEKGQIDLALLRNAIRPTTLLISLMYANNETGLLHPIEDIGAMAREHGVYFHCDAVGAAGKIPIDLNRLPIDFLSFSAHKFYGPKGIGGLYCRRGLTLPPFMYGGKQELGKRPGTENVPAIVAMADALAAVTTELPQETTRLLTLRQQLLDGLRRRFPNCRLNTLIDQSISNTLNITFPGLDAESAVIALDLEGIALSTGSACASGATDPSHVLLSMGRSVQDAKSALRFSLGKENTMEEIEVTLDVLSRVLPKCGASLLHI